MVVTLVQLISGGHGGSLHTQDLYIELLTMIQGVLSYDYKVQGAYDLLHFDIP
jgi:hypothetical protein